jgi:hypothetical protein
VAACAWENKMDQPNESLHNCNAQTGILRYIESHRTTGALTL